MMRQGIVAGMQPAKRLSIAYDEVASPVGSILSVEAR